MRDFIRRLSPTAEFLIVTAICLAYGAVAFVAALSPRPVPVELSTAYIGRAILLQLVLLITAAAVLRVRGWDARRLGLEFSWRSAAAGIPIFILYLLLYSIAATVLLLVWPAAREVWAFRYTVTAPLGLMVLFVIVNACFEEAAVTAYVVTSLSDRGAALAVAVSTLLRVAYHLYQGPLVWAGLIPIGLVFAAMFLKWRNLWPLIVAHAVANLVALAVDPQRAR